MESESLSSMNEASEQSGEKGSQEISISHHQINGLEHTSHKASDSFIVDIERFSSHFASDKDITANSRITRNLSRKGSQLRGAEKKLNPIVNNERDNGSLAISPRGSMPGKPVVVAVGATDQRTSNHPQVHNPITIMTGSLRGATVAESKSSSVSRRFSFRRSTWTIGPRKILFFFATLSSIGTILLIYFALSINKRDGDENGLY